MIIKEYRKKAKKTQLELSVDVGISLQQLQKIEQGKILLKDVKYKTVETLYYLLSPEGISIFDFVEDNDWAIIWDKAKKESK